MSRLWVLAAVAVALSACSGSTPTASHSPTASPTEPASGSASASATSPSASASPGPAALVHCTVPVPTGDNLVIGSVNGDPTVVVRDIQDPSNARNVCAFDANVIGPQFVSATTVSYETPDGSLLKARLAAGTTTVMGTFAPGINNGQYAISPDGSTATYLDGGSWHLAGPSGDKVVTTLPALPARGVNPNQDDSYLAFSPDGQYIALFQTFRIGGSGATAPDQIRHAGDGSLVYSTSGMTMAVWASSPTRLYFRDGKGGVKRWNPATGVEAVVTLPWIRPRSSPDGRWIAYTTLASSGLEQFGLYGVPANQVQPLPLTGRTGVAFLNNDLVFYLGQRACSNCLGPERTGVSYIYDIAGGTEVISRLSAVYDAWPHTSS